LFKFGGAPEAGLLAKLTDASVEAFDHAVCLGMTRGDEAMVDVGAGAGLVEEMIAGRLCFCREVKRSVNCAPLSVRIVRM
jgi:hypothetical protein